MAVKAAWLEAELKFHDLESQKTASLKKQEDEVKKTAHGKGTGRYSSRIENGKQNRRRAQW